MRCLALSIAQGHVRLPKAAMAGVVAERPRVACFTICIRVSNPRRGCLHHRCSVSLSLSLSLSACVCVCVSFLKSERSKPLPELRTLALPEPLTERFTGDDVDVCPVSFSDDDVYRLLCFLYAPQWHWCRIILVEPHKEREATHETKEGGVQA